MKRKDIKRSTVYIIGFCIVAFAAINAVLLLHKPNGNQCVPEDEDIISDYYKIHDTINNSIGGYVGLEDMESEIERFRQRWEIKGLAVAVSRHDSLLYAQGFGISDVDHGMGMEPNKRTRIASVSKLITAAAIMKLKEAGKLSLEDKVFGDNGILNDKDFTEAIRDQRIFNIRVVDLLRHQGGFTLGAGDPMFNTVELKKAKHLDHAPDNHELATIVLSRRLGFQPGVGRKYSNFGYMLLSLVIEKVSGQTYWNYVIDNLLRPAGCIGFRPADNYYMPDDFMQTGFYSSDDELVESFEKEDEMVDRCYGGANITGLMGAGGWSAPATSLIRFVAAIDGDPTYPDVISPESVAQMTAYEEDKKLALGWSDSDGKGHWTRSGTLSSAHALVERFPDGECWVITTNTGVWTGFHFTRDMQRLIDNLRRKYSDRLPTRDLFEVQYFK